MDQVDSRACTGAVRSKAAPRATHTRTTIGSRRPAASVGDFRHRRKVPATARRHLAVVRGVHGELRRSLVNAGQHARHGRHGQLAVPDLDASRHHTFRVRTSPTAGEPRPWCCSRRQGTGRAAQARTLQLLKRARRRHTTTLLLRREREDVDRPLPVAKGRAATEMSRGSVRCSHRHVRSSAERGECLLDSS
jgi:hypothetical protein